MKMPTKSSGAWVRQTNQMLEMTRMGIENVRNSCACTLGILGCYDSPTPGTRMGSEKGNGDDQGLDQGEKETTEEGIQ